MKSHLRSNRGLDRSNAEFGILKNKSDDWQFCEHWSFSEIHKQYHKHSEEYKSLETLNWCLGALEFSPTGRLLLKDITEQGWSVGLTDLSEKDFILNTGRKLLMLDNHGLGPDELAQSDHFTYATLIAMIHALRDISHEHGQAGFYTRYNPESVLMLERVRVADCHAIAALIAWELRSAGLPEIWRQMIGCTDSDIALMYSTYMEQNPASSFGKKALAAAFHQWFACEDRIDACDHDALEYLDSVLHAAKKQNPFGAERFNAAHIEALSCLPDKTAYLHGQGERILRDPVYAGLDDEYNQIHYLQLMHDLQAIFVAGVPFRDANLAKRVFPAAFAAPSKEAV